jgi:hypothetical protein
MAKKASYTKTSIRKYKNKDGAIRTTVVKGHNNKLNRKPRKK